MSFPQHDSYADSGEPWVGKVPSHWQKSALKYLAHYQNGHPFKPEDWSETGRPIIRIAQLTGNSEPDRYSGSLDERVSVSAGDLLFSWSATLDCFFWTGETGWLNQHIFKVTPTAQCDKRFLFYLLRYWAEKLGDFDAHGSTMRHIKKESLSQRVHVPDKSEQLKIADFLDSEVAKIDDLLREQNQLLQKLVEKRKAIVSKNVFPSETLDLATSDLAIGAWRRVAARSPQEHV